MSETTVKNSCLCKMVKIPLFRRSPTKLREGPKSNGFTGQPQKERDAATPASTATRLALLRKVRVSNQNSVTIGRTV